MFKGHWFWRRYIGDYDAMHSAETELAGEASRELAMLHIYVQTVGQPSLTCCMQLAQS
jgi:hypothetical protein